MKITQGPTNRLEHCCDCGACSEHIDPIQHARVCDGIRKEQQWTVCGIYHYGDPQIVKPWKQQPTEEEAETEDPNDCRECGQDGTMVLKFKAEAPLNILVYTCRNCDALEISDGVAMSQWYRPIAGVFSK